jgi:hypothetical protein
VDDEVRALEDTHLGGRSAGKVSGIVQRGQDLVRDGD